MTERRRMYRFTIKKARAAYCFNKLASYYLFLVLAFSLILFALNGISFESLRMSAIGALVPTGIACFAVAVSLGFTAFEEGIRNERARKG